MTTFRTPTQDDFDDLITGVVGTHTDLAIETILKVKGKFIKASGAGGSRMYVTALREALPLFKDGLRQIGVIAVEFHQVHGFDLAAVLERTRYAINSMIQRTLDSLAPCLRKTGIKRQVGT